MFEPIGTCPDAPEMFVAIAVLANYTTDPWCVWKSPEGFARWPHPFPPTHWMKIPDTPRYVDVNDVEGLKTKLEQLRIQAAHQRLKSMGSMDDAQAIIHYDKAVRLHAKIHELEKLLGV